MAKAAAAPAVVNRRSRVAREARRIWSSTANPDGAGVFERGREYRPTSVNDFDPLVVSALISLARLTDSVAETMRDCPEASVRRAAAVLAARAHPVRAAFDDS